MTFGGGACIREDVVVGTLWLYMDKRTPKFDVASSVYIVTLVINIPYNRKTNSIEFCLDTE